MEAEVMSEVAKVVQVVDIAGTAGTVEHMERVAAAAAVLLHHEVLGPFFHVHAETCAFGEAIEFSVGVMDPFVAHAVHKGSCPSAACMPLALLVAPVGCPASHHEHKTDP